MKIALVHDYLNEFGGAERVLAALSESYPEAPIYTAFYKPGSPAHDYFKDKQIIVSWGQKVPGFVSTLHSPLRFLAPLIWESFNFDDYEVVISSSGWYVTKGILTRPETVHICYLHTPPRHLYGYETSIAWQKHWPIRLYARIVNKSLRQYDFLTSQRVDHFIANSQEVKGRIAKFYRRDATVIYPPVDVHVPKAAENRKYFLTGGRLVGAKHFDLIINVANQLKIPLKIFGSGPLEDQLKAMAGPTITFTGRVDEPNLAKLYRGAKAFIALAKDEDFGITPVEAMACGTPVIAYYGGGYRETVIEGKTGIFIHSHSQDALTNAIKKLENQTFLAKTLQIHAAKYNQEVFTKKITSFVAEKLAKHQQAL